MKVLHWPLCYSTVVPEGGNDPPTPSLSRMCSTTELLGYKMWPVRRDSNSRQLVSKTRTLPLSYGPLVPTPGNAPGHSVLQTDASTWLAWTAMGYPMGFEPMLLEPQPKVLTSNTTDTINWQGVQGSNL